MSNANDFIIENGVLKKYVGPGGDVVIPEGVTEIGHHAFYYCKSLTSVSIPSSVTEIYNSAFQGCGSLTSISIPESVTKIDSSAFGFYRGFTIHAPAGSYAEGYAKKEKIRFVAE